MDDNIKMQIAFPKSDEDHRLQLVSVNGKLFAIFFGPLESKGPINLYCDGWSLILLSPVKSKSKIMIAADNIICLNEIVSEEGNVNLHASNQLVKFAHQVTSSENAIERGEKGEFQFSDDPTVFMYFYRLFESIVADVRNDAMDTIPEAQKNIIVALCALSDKINGKQEQRNLQKALEFWGIPQVTL